jgi:hypothetical protein
LHEHFRKREVNRINHRKEFFRVGVKEIEDVVKQNHGAIVDFVYSAPAEEFYASCQIAAADESDAAAS